METFYLIRHGQKEHTHIDMNLTPFGHQQAQKTALYLKQFPITQLVASPMKRTQQTAQHIAKTLQLAVETNRDLRERMEWFPDVHPAFEDFIEDWKYHSTHRTLTPNYGDSSHYAGERFQKVIENLSKNPHKHTALVTHGGVIIDFIRNAFAHKVIESLIPNYLLRMQEEVLVRECSVTIFTIKKNVYTLESFSYDKHLT